MHTMIQVKQPRRIEQITVKCAAICQLAAVLLKKPFEIRCISEQMRWITSKWGVSENNRRAKYYSITRAGRK
jgi:hypothetical protein